MIGLTGNKNEISDVAKKYRVYHSKTTATKDYLIDHSIITVSFLKIIFIFQYLINPDGEFETFYGKNTTPEEMENSIIEYVKKWKIL